MATYARLEAVNELVRFALCAFYPGHDDWPGLAELDVDAKIARLRSETTRLLWFGVAAGALFFQVAPILTLGRPTLAVFLEDEALDEHAHRIASHRFYLVRQIVMMLKLMGGMLWGQAPEIREKLALAPYPEDPGTRRVESFVAPHIAPPRDPEPRLVTLGRKEVARGRVDDEHALFEGKNA